MEYKGFKASIKEAERLTGDYVHSLPPGDSIPVYHSDSFLKYPENWMKGPGVFVIPVKPNKGLWFDWTMNDSNNTAILPTVKGCNPITGLQTSGFFLERYDNKCPKHGCNFEADRYCPECNYKWAPQNYVCAPNTLWWDGFRADDGTVRQFFFTEEMMRDIATAMIGKENTVPAFGFAFYSPKERRPEIKTEPRHTYNLLYIKQVFDPSNIYYFAPSNNINSTLGSTLNSVDFSSIKGVKGISGSSGKSGFRSIKKIKKYSSSDHIRGAGFGDHINLCSSNLNESAPVLFAQPDNSEIKLSCDSVNEEYNSSSYPDKTNFVPEKEVAVGAGAKIRQSLNQDNYPLDSWKDKPDAVMTLYFVFQSEFEKMAAGGLKDVEGRKEGMLEGLPVG